MNDSIFFSYFTTIHKDLHKLITVILCSYISPPSKTWDLKALTKAEIFQNRKWVRLTSGCSLWRRVWGSNPWWGDWPREIKKSGATKPNARALEPNPKPYVRVQGSSSKVAGRQNQGNLETVVGSVDRQHFTRDMMKGLQCLKDWNCLQFSLLSFLFFFF